MQKVSLFFAMILLIFTASAVESEITGVRVYTHGAEISRKAQAPIPAGTAEIVISGLAAQLDPNSIQLKGNGNFTILSVSHRINYLESPQYSRIMQQLQDSLSYYKDELDLKQSMLKVYEEEESLVLANKSIGGNDTGVQVGELRSVADFFRSRLAEVKKLQLDARREIVKLQERHNRIRQQILQHNALGNQPVGELVITTTAPRATNGTFELSYLAWQAGWSAAYDVRAENTEKPVELVLKASVRQSTGEDWKEVPLVLSTGNPRANMIKPELQPWFLRFVEPVRQRTIAPERAKMAEPMMMDMISDEISINEENAELAIFAQVSTYEMQTTTEYRISIPFTLPSGNQPQVVEVQKNELPAECRWFAAPKLDKEAFLIARLTGWEEYLRLPGEASLFFEGAYIGKSFIDPANVADTLQISLGTDRGVVIERNRLTEFSRKSILGRRTTETVGWEIVVRNTRNREINLEIQDQIPVSTHADMQINLEEQSGARFDQTNGMLHWQIKLSASETQRKIFRYSVRYPADKIIRLE